MDTLYNELSVYFKFKTNYKIQLLKSKNTMKREVKDFDLHGQAHTTEIQDF